MLAVDKSKVFTQLNIIKIFKMLDKSGDGNIDAQEFKALVPEDVKNHRVAGDYIKRERDLWNSLLAKFDKNGDGQLNLEEFQNLIQSFVRDNTASLSPRKRGHSRKVSRSKLYSNCPSGIWQTRPFYGSPGAGKFSKYF